MFDASGYSERVAAEALAGLSTVRKTLPAKLLYDAEGCRLFGEITRLPEYYVTRTERSMLAEIAPGLPLPGEFALVEYGASDEAKAAILLNALPVAAYVPIDVAGAALELLRARLAISHAGLDVHPIEADFLQPLTLPASIQHLTRVGFFPGSTIGNLDPIAARVFLQQVKTTLGDDALLLIGVDLRKDTAVLLPAYDDRQGITAAFNRNLLVRLNREARADFDIDAFLHRAIWNEASGRIEMHLESQRAQSATVAGTVISFAAGETIHTENSYKHTVDGFRALAQSAGWRTLQTWTDPDDLFSLHLLSAAGR